MLCAVIPTLNAENSLEPLLAQLTGQVDRLIVADGGSVDATLKIACGQGAVIAMGAPGRGHQLARGARWAYPNQGGDADWLLFLHADATLPDNWRDLIDQHMTKRPETAGYFRFGADAKGVRARAMEFWVGLRCFWLKWPYGDQGLLISRTMYDALGGYPAQILFEDVALIKALKAKFGRRALKCIPGIIKTDISAYQRDGFWKRGVRNLGFLRAYLKGENVEALAQKYK